MKTNKNYRSAIIAVIIITLVYSYMPANTAFAGDTDYHTVTFDANGGYLHFVNVSINSKTVLSGSNIGTLPIPKRAEDYIFLGWFAPDGQKISEDTIINGDITFTARWEPAIITVKFDVNGGKLDVNKSINLDLTINSKKNPVVLPHPTPPSSDKVFIGWYLHQSGFFHNDAPIRLNSRMIHAYEGWHDSPRAGGYEIRKFCQEKDLRGTITLVAHYRSTLGNETDFRSDNATLEGRETGKTRKVNLNIVKWNIKNKVKVTIDGKRDKGVVSVKIGTATLNKKSPANMVLTSENLQYYNTGEGTKKYNRRVYAFIVYKGKKKVDVYAPLEMNSKQRKRVKKYKNTTVAAKFKYDSLLCLCGETYCKGIKNAKANYVAPLALRVYGKKTSSSNFMKSGSVVNAPTINKNFKIVVKSKKLSLGGSLKKKSPYYKAAKKMVGQKTNSCQTTAGKLIKKVTKSQPNIGIVGGSDVVGTGLLLPVNKARSGDELIQDGHVSIYLGGKQSLHGSMTSGKTWIGPSEIRRTYFAVRPYWNIFYVNK